MHLSHTITYQTKSPVKGVGYFFFFFELFDQGIQQNPKTTQPISIAPD